LRRRKVFGVAAAYAVVAFGVIEVSGTVLQMAQAPTWIGRVVLAVAAIGFPIAITLAWFFDLPQHGDVQRARALAAVAGLAIFALSGFAIWLRPDSRFEPEFVQLTNFSDAATAPALSPDGNSVVFLKGRGFFANSAARSQVYIMELPRGSAVQLTNSNYGKATPQFTRDGNDVVFTSAEDEFRWHTHKVSTHGGSEAELLPNASGLTWLDSGRVMFAETAEGVHMGIRRARLDRSEAQDVYWPQREHGMAHRAVASPDGKWILVAEMDMGAWLPCRLIAADNSAPGRPVGPLKGQCTYSAWSPDGKWMYFSSNASGLFHIWRQRFPNGEPEQITNGPTEEEGLAIAPDGKSLITSAGVRHNSIWLSANGEDRQLSIEEYAFDPVATRDGERVYYLRRAPLGNVAYYVGYLTAISIRDGAREELFPDHPMLHFSLSADDRLIAFTGVRDSAHEGIWIAPLDRSAAPRRVLRVETERGFFDDNANIYFLQVDGQSRHLHRLRAPDYTRNERVYDGALRHLFAISPDGAWVVAAQGDKNGIGQIAVSTRGQAPRVICSHCGGGAGPARILAPAISWTRDGRAMLVSSQFTQSAGMIGQGNTYVIPVRPNQPLPNLPAGGIKSGKDYLALPGVREIAKTNALPGATVDQVLFYESTTIRNLYRVTLPR
jgi:eukaryotic-like serine/threonine-protein kinase